MRIEDVTQKVLEGTAAISDENERAAKIERNVAALVKSSPKNRGKRTVFVLSMMVTNISFS